MNLYEQIKEDLLVARKEHNEEVKRTLLTLLSEADRELISKQLPERQNEIMKTVVQKYEKGLLKALDQFGGNKTLEKEYKSELEIISPYLPKKLSTEEIKKILHDEFGPVCEFGQAMKFLSSNYKGLFDAKEVKNELFTNGA